MSNYTTLGELRAMIGSTAGLEKPTMKKLRESGEPIETYISGDYRLEAYQSGFVLAVSGRHALVVKADERREYTYIHKDHTGEKPEYEAFYTVDESVFLDQPWPIRIMLNADDQFQKNEEDRERKWISKHPEIPDDKNWMCGGHASFEDEVCDRIDRERALECLTEKQRVVFRLYYEEGYTQDEVAEQLGLGRTTVRNHLEAIITKLRKQYW